MIRKSFAGIGVLLFTFYIAATVSAPATTHTYFPADTIPSRFGFGAPASEARIAVWDIDVRPDGKGLPEGTGSVIRGKEIYQLKCASCHGVTGKEGPFDKLVFDPDSKAKTIGNYWPYATTVFDYIQRAMPFNQPGSLTPAEVYSLTAYLLYENKIIEETTVITKNNLATIQMPAHGLFIPDTRTDGPEIK